MGFLIKDIGQKILKEREREKQEMFVLPPGVSSSLQHQLSQAIAFHTVSYNSRMTLNLI